MGTTTQAVLNKLESTAKQNRNTYDSVLDTSIPDTKTNTHTITAETTTNSITSTITSTTHITNNEIKYTSEENTSQNIKLLLQVSPPQQVVTIPATESSAVATNAARKIRRAFSIPKNPFRWSHKFKTTGMRTASSAAGQTITDKSQDSGGGKHKGRGSAIIGFSSLTKSYTLSCVGGKRERTGSFISLDSNDDNYLPPTNNTTTHSGTPHNKNCKQVQSIKHLNHDFKDKSNGITTKSSNKKLTTKSNTINGVSSLSNSSTLPTGASLFSTLPASASNSANANSNNRVFRRSSFRKFLNRIAQHITNASNKPTVTANGHTISSTADRVPPISGYQWPNDQTPGVMGLKNHGNTCFMNAVLQCLSHTDILAEYFVLDQYKADLKRRNKSNSRKFGTKGELTEQLANVLKALWTCRNESDHSTSFKAVVDRYGSQFRSSTQHDAQEFLFWLLDKVHEDLNTATKRRYKSVKANIFWTAEAYLKQLPSIT